MGIWAGSKRTDRICIDAEDEREKTGMCKSEEAGRQETWLRSSEQTDTGYG